MSIITGKRRETPSIMQIKWTKNSIIHARIVVNGQLAALFKFFLFEINRFLKPFVAFVDIFPRAHSQQSSCENLIQFRAAIREIEPPKNAKWARDRRHLARASLWQTTEPGNYPHSALSLHRTRVMANVIKASAQQAIFIFLDEMQMINLIYSTLERACNAAAVLPASEPERLLSGSQPGPKRCASVRKTG